MSRKVELFASTFRLSRWLQGKAHASALKGTISESPWQPQMSRGYHLASICAERVHASKMSTTVPRNSSSAISWKRISRFSAVNVLESANDLQNHGIVVSISPPPEHLMSCYAVISRKLVSHLHFNGHAPDCIFTEMQPSK